MQIGIYGLGRFGAFWASVLAEHFDVLTYNRSDKPTPPGTTKTDIAGLCGCDTVFLCTSISSMSEVARKLAPHLTKTTLVADTCSVKTYPLDVLSKELPGDVPIMGTHPMFGPDSAVAGMRGLPLVLTPARHSESHVSLWRDRFTSMGLRVIDMTAEEHDREAAVTQGVTHLVGRVLDEFGLVSSTISTKGYSALSEIVEQTCNDPRSLFLDLQRFNPFTPDMRRRLATAFAAILDEVESLEAGGAAAGRGDGTGRSSVTGSGEQTGQVDSPIE